jgi:hypothetical protein
MIIKIVATIRMAAISFQECIQEMNFLYVSWSELDYVVPLNLDDPSVPEHTLLGHPLERKIFSIDLVHLFYYVDPKSALLVSFRQPFCRLISYLLVYFLFILIF